MSDASRASLRSAAQLALAALLATALIAGTRALTHDRLADAELHASRQALQIVLPVDHYDNDPVADAVKVRAEPWLGLETATVHRARLQGESSALVLELSAPDGYAGAIALRMAVDRDGRVLGVRVVAHRETPGLGDDIEATRSDWITRFSGRSLGQPVPQKWAVRRDGGDFDQFAGATVTPRAVVGAVKRGLQFVARHGDEIRGADAGATLSFTTHPDTDALP